MAKEKETTKESTKTNLFDYNEERAHSIGRKKFACGQGCTFKLGDGSGPDDGIYVLVKEVIDNCIDEFAMGYGKTVELVGKKESKSPSLRLWARYFTWKSGGRGE